MTVNLRFPGPCYDDETGLHYNYFRDYEPDMGRYTESDPIGLAGELNTYAYVGSNPLRFVDPLGLVCVVCKLSFTHGVLGVARVYAFVGANRLFVDPQRTPLTTPNETGHRVLGYVIHHERRVSFRLGRSIEGKNPVGVQCWIPLVLQLLFQLLDRLMARLHDATAQPFGFAKEEAGVTENRLHAGG